MHERGQRRRSVDDGRVDDLTQAGPLALEQGGEHPGQQEHAAASEVPEHVQRNLGRSAGPADRVQCPGDGDVVDVVAGHLAPRAGLAPAGHPPVDEPRIALPAYVRADAESLGHIGPERLEQHVGAVNHGQQRLWPCCVLQIDQHRPPAAADDRPGWILGLARAVDPHDIGAQVGQQHRAVGRWPEPGQLHDPQAGQRAVRAGCHNVLRPVVRLAIRAQSDSLSILF